MDTFGNADVVDAKLLSACHTRMMEPVNAVRRRRLSKDTEKKATGDYRYIDTGTITICWRLVKAVG